MYCSIIGGKHIFWHTELDNIISLIPDKTKDKQALLTIAEILSGIIGIASQLDNDTEEGKVATRLKKLYKQKETDKSQMAAQVVMKQEEQLLQNNILHMEKTEFSLAR